jgi:type IV pilus assembly protein PilC
MLLSRRLPTSDLIELCRTLRHYLGAGLTLRDVFRQQADRGPAAVRPVAGRIAAELEQGNDLQHALGREEAVFPPLVVSMTGVGEESGMLAEVFAELEHYYRRQQKLRRDFIAQITWPVIQFVLGVLVVAAMILILGIIAQSHGPGTKAFDPLGFGTGPRAAAVFLGVVVGVLAGLAGAYFGAKRVLRKPGQVDAWLLRVPVLGPCLMALALARFCLALRLTTETGMPIASALKLSLRATGNGAFMDGTPAVVGAVRKGKELTAALGKSRLFPFEFQNVMQVAEETGNLPDVLKHQANYYDEEAGRRLTILAGAATWGVWLVVGGLMVWTIFRIFTSYIQQLQV